jgi:hypothetical protein
MCENLDYYSREACPGFPPTTAGMTICFSGDYKYAIYVLFSSNRRAMKIFF